MFERSIIATLVLLAPAVHAEQPLLADPLRPEDSGPAVEQVDPAAPSAVAGLPRLSMIVRNQRRHYAVIDGHPRHVGEQWAGYRVLAIRPSSVLLEREGEQPLELRLLSGAVSKRPVANTIGADSTEGYSLSLEKNPRP